MFIAQAFRPGPYEPLAPRTTRYEVVGVCRSSDHGLVSNAIVVVLVKVNDPRTVEMLRGEGKVCGTDDGGVREEGTGVSGYRLREVHTTLVACLLLVSFAGRGHGGIPSKYHDRGPGRI